MDAIATQDDRLIHDVLQICHDRLPADQAKLIAPFASQLVPREALIDDNARAAEQAYGALMSIWKLVQTRTPDQRLVRVYNPRLDEHGWTSPFTVIETATRDMPFIVDSIVAALSGFDGQIFGLLHPVVAIQRDTEGHFTSAAPDAEGAAPESIMQINFSLHSNPDDLAAIEGAVRNVLEDVSLAVADWRAMLDRASDILSELSLDPPPLDSEDVDEAHALLEWMTDNHFTFLGYREYDYLASRGKESLEIVEGTGLGLLRDPNRRVMQREDGEPALSPEVQEFLQRPELVIVTKANRRSTVHRRVYLDYIGIKRMNAAGEIIGERRFVGLFTSAAYSRTPRDIPYLRRKTENVLKRSGFDTKGHAGKALVNVLDTYPRDELFQISEDELLAISTGVMGLLDRPRIKMFIRKDRFGRFYSCLIYVPRERYDSELRRIYERILAKTLGGTIQNFYTQIGDEPLARLHVVVAGAAIVGSFDNAELEARLIAATQSWEDGVRNALTEAHGEEQGGDLFRKYENAFSVAYQEAFAPGMARIDIDHIEATGTDTPNLNLYRRLEDAPTTLRLKLFHRGELLALSDVLPMMENMGLRVLSEQSYPVGEPHAPWCWIHDFEMQPLDGAARALAEIKPAFEEGFLKIFIGEMENDGFNSLIVAKGMSTGEVVLLRAYCKFLRQAGIAFSQEYMEQTLARNGEITSLILELFFCMFDPTAADNDATETTAQTIAESVQMMLENVSSLDEDRILRRYLNAVQSTLRTSYFQNNRDVDGLPYLSLKFDSMNLEDLPLPRPHKEIFVYSPRFEGVHLRGGPVARGGLRWSDRREDFRTEVLSLVKAQMVKNAVIVPVGSKGGFVPKRPPASGDREAVMAEGITCYKTFISGLLDITDNIVEGAVVPPGNVVRRDEDDPYLVVAADKGTATFSDFANQVAIDYGFWLGDAFASGGAAGYDHKGMGITARGAWECVKRHFREMGHDIQTQPFTVVGVGDMSGDVFGNGMLLSEQTKLLGAFDHRHIFLDPDPDPASSFVERKRLFELGRSSWDDYDRSVMSDGGMIVDRAAKKVTLTPQIAAALDVAPGEMTPQQVLQAVLRAPADLLWFGGIGTYVKSSDESHAEAGDRANDVIRINGEDLQIKVIGEGANLGITQLGRVEFAMNGGRINTDFVDNSAGVDCSDHEVNLKILLGAVEASGDMTRKQRDSLLSSMTDRVAELVLEDNYIQGQAITLAEAAETQGSGPMLRLMRSFGQSGFLNREVEFLPSDEDMAERKGGLTRPELSVLLSYAKMALKSELMAGELPDDPGQETHLLNYFPEVLQKQFRDQIMEHRLHREIIATIAANFIVNRCGPSFGRLVQDEMGVSASDVGRVALAVAEIFDLHPVWQQIDALDNKIDADVQTRMLDMTQSLMQRAGRWFLRQAAPGVDRQALVDRFAPAIAGLRSNLRDLLSDIELAAWDRRKEALTTAGIDPELAEFVAALQPLAGSLDVVIAAETAGRDVTAVAATHFAIGNRLGLDWLRTQAGTISAENTWERQAIQTLVEESFRQQMVLVSQCFADGANDADGALAQLSERHPRDLARTDQLISEIRAASGIDLGRMVLANRQVGRLIV